MCKILFPILVAFLGVLVGFFQAFTDSDFSRRLNTLMSEATITSYSGVVAFPASVGGCPMKTLGDAPTPIFGWNNTSVTSVTIPDSMTSIGAGRSNTVHA
jgi:hypothetical protein